ncbi:MAG TPA: UDP-N-acetylglucosamine--N-acetylmuramyl-(pentapeptide) pyrophosphoryl-undecaprenol N-acetylglucosamine transferase [Acidimicrobiales bacterium]|nr:UDP-N-acetylglucosamine--N-acetylmuramyl-(pentapeptide) pyrophosphoryl-undecaprenol N-acetylglucosamine transferase [Acidimicrobiales bacterium]
MNARPWAVFAGGGTGGHLYPGLAVAAELVERGHDPSTLHFVGAKRGLEARTKALEAFPATFLPGRGLSRSRAPVAVRQNLLALVSSAQALVRAVMLFARWRPAVVVSLGGYASFPCVAAAVITRCPIVVVNVDAVAGAVNRWAARFAKVCAVGAPAVDVPRSVYTGVPVRRSLGAVDRSPEGRARARRSLGLPESGWVVAVSGGSLGARSINEAALGLGVLWAGRTDVCIFHVVGRRDWEVVSPRCPSTSGGLRYIAVPYQEDMASLYAAADVAVQRAGANTVAELALAGVPCVLVPLPGSPGDHQGANARALAATGAGVVVADNELGAERLASELDALFSDPGRLDAMGERARSLARPGAAAKVADLVEQSARGRGLAQPGHADPEAKPS